jgi:hypothetical protein
LISVYEWYQENVTYRGGKAVLEGNTKILVMCLSLIISILTLLGLLGESLTLYLGHVQLKEAQMS